jgi:glutamate-ammonia-ligase adenylyltransferase
MAMTRARVVWASTPDFAAEAEAILDEALRQTRIGPRALASDVASMRALLDEEKPPSGEWDCKLCPGGFVDIEFSVQYLQLLGAAAGQPVMPNTAEALEALAERQAAPPALIADLQAAWSLQQAVVQLLRVALTDAADPTSEPAAFRRRLAKSAGARDFRTLVSRLRAARAKARMAFQALVQA